MDSVNVWQVLDALLSIGCFVLGLTTVFVIISSVIRSFVLPRAQNAWLTRLVFLTVFRLLDIYMNWRKINTYKGRDRILAFFAPVSVLLLPIVWLIFITLGYMFMYWAMGVRPWEEAFTISGSSLLTLGTTPFVNTMVTIFQFSEATLGLGLVALLLAYLPTMYSSFARREAVVSMLVIRAGSPPSAVELITRAFRIRGLAALNSTWEDLEIWFTEVEESHTSLAPLIFFRSPLPENSWITAAGKLLDYRCRGYFGFGGADGFDGGCAAGSLGSVMYPCRVCGAAAHCRFLFLRLRSQPAVPGDADNNQPRRVRCGM